MFTQHKILKFHHSQCATYLVTFPKKEHLPTKIGEGFEIVAVNVSDLCHLRDTVLAYTDPSAVSIPLFNDTNDYYYLHANNKLAQIEHLTHEIAIYKMQMKSLNGEVYKINNEQPSFISNDEFMSEEEQELLGQISSTVEQDCTTKKDDFRVLRKKFDIKI
jgi:hypothetical protein